VRPLRDQLRLGTGRRSPGDGERVSCRRLNLAVGESAEVTAAWFRIPEFRVEPLRQRYTRLAEDTYRYESPDHDFTATLTVDDLGLVVVYDPGWVRLTSTDAVPRASRFHQWYASGSDIA
jgi:hypothetical protein